MADDVKINGLQIMRALALHGIPVSPTRIYDEIRRHGAKPGIPYIPRDVLAKVLGGFVLAEILHERDRWEKTS